MLSAEIILINGKALSLHIFAAIAVFPVAIGPYTRISLFKVLFQIGITSNKTDSNGVRVDVRDWFTSLSNVDQSESKASPYETRPFLNKVLSSVWSLLPKAGIIL
jgi:hypothetical protein